MTRFVSGNRCQTCSAPASVRLQQHRDLDADGIMPMSCWHFPGLPIHEFPLAPSIRQAQELSFRHLPADRKGCLRDSHERSPVFGLDVAPINQYYSIGHKQRCYSGREQHIRGED